MSVKYFLKNPRSLYHQINKKGFLRWVPDRIHLPIYFRLIRGEKLDLRHPRTFNEKLQWIKLYDRDPLYTTLADKAAVKEYVGEKIGFDHVIPALGVFDSFEEIDFDALPDQFVLKCTHDSASTVICTDKASFDLAEAEKKLTSALKRDYYMLSREWAYKNIPHRIIAEPFIADESGVELKDYKVFCFGGEPRLIQVDYDRFGSHGRNLYTTEWEYVPESTNVRHPGDPSHVIPRPEKLDEMLSLASILSAGIPEVRVDFYMANDTVLLGEFTFYHAGGFASFSSREFDLQMGDWIVLPEKK